MEFFFFGVQAHWLHWNFVSKYEGSEWRCSVKKKGGRDLDPRLKRWDRISLAFRVTRNNAQRCVGDIHPVSRHIKQDRETGQCSQMRVRCI
jgi:hypothetical protein